MPVHFDINDDVLYQEGKLEGLEQGLEKGLEQGLERGQEKVILTMLKKSLSTEEIANLADLAVEKVKAIKAKHGL